MVGVYYALLLPNPLELGFDEIRAGTKWIDGPVASLESNDVLSLRHGQGGHIVLQKIDMQRGTASWLYDSAIFCRFDLNNIESAALAWEVILTVLSDRDGFDIWNAAYPAETIAKYAELRPLKLLNVCGYVMRASEFDHLAERPPG